MSRRLSRPLELPPLLGTDEDDLAKVTPQLRRLRALQKAYAKPIIAAGIFTTSKDLWSGIVQVLAMEAGRNDKRALDAFFERLQSAGVSTDIPRPSREDPNDTDVASDVWAR